MPWPSTERAEQTHRSLKEEEISQGLGGLERVVVRFQLKLEK